MVETSRLRLLVWRAGAVRCAAPIERLREVLPAVAVTALPGAPPSVRGVANVRGLLVTIVDGRRLLGEPDARPPGATILVDFDGRPVGLAVDEVEDLIEVADAALTPRGAGPAMGWEVAFDEGPPVRMLDLDHLLEPLFRD